MPGPPPKRSDQRRRRNRKPVQKAPIAATPNQPKLTGTHTAAARRFWVRLGESGQSRFYQPSDWAKAELIVVAIDAFTRKPTPTMLRAIFEGMTGLLVSEGDRRRLGLELDTSDGVDPEEAAAVVRLDEVRRRYGTD